MDIKVTINYPEDMSFLEKRASQLMADILIKKLQPKEIENLIKVLQEDKYELTW